MDHKVVDHLCYCSGWTLCKLPSSSLEAVGERIPLLTTWNIESSSNREANEYPSTRSCYVNVSYKGAWTVLRGLVCLEPHH